MGKNVNKTEGKRTEQKKGTKEAGKKRTEPNYIKWDAARVHFTSVLFVMWIPEPTVCLMCAHAGL